MFLTMVTILTVCHFLIEYFFHPTWKAVNNNLSLFKHVLWHLFVIFAVSLSFVSIEKAMIIAIINCILHIVIDKLVWKMHDECCSAIDYNRKFWHYTRIGIDQLFHIVLIVISVWIVGVR